MIQNIWQNSEKNLQRQKRRAQLVKTYLKKSSAKRILDIGSAEGYATSFISKTGAYVVGIEINIEYIKIARQKVKTVDFINASLEDLPFRADYFDAVCILEVLEHLNITTQKKGLKEVDRILRQKATLIISVPYKEKIIQTNCIHCGKTTPLYGHLRSLDEFAIQEILPECYDLLRTCRLPNLQIVSCKSIFQKFPLSVWLLLNNILGLIGKGYWIVCSFAKR